MIPTVRHSIVLAAILFPLWASAGTQAEVPTSIQVVDQSGKTTVSTSTPAIVSEKPRVLFSIPEICTPFLKQENSKSLEFPPLPESHPLSTRIESQRATLQTLIDKLSFAPYLPQKEELFLKEYLLSPAEVVSTSSEPIECLSLLSSEFHARSGKDAGNLSRQISETRKALQYGIRNLRAQEIETPENEYEALYAGDLLLSRCPTCISLSIREDRMELDFLLPVRILGRWESVQETHLLFHDGSARFDVPWWLFLGSHRLSDIKKRIDNIGSQKEGITGMYFRARAVVTILSP